MSLRINQNPLAIGVHRQLANTQHALDRAVTRLSSGLRVNYAWDDPAGLAVSERMRAQISSMTEAERNANYAINMLATAEGALATIDEKLIRMRALSIEASSGTLTSLDRSYLDTEFQQLKSEITRIANVTNYNGLYLIDGTYAEGAVGPGSQGIKLHIGTYNVSNQDFYYVHLADMTSSGLGLLDVNLLNTAAAQSAIDTMDAVIDTKDTERTRIGSYVTRLQATVQNLQISRENAVASESMIRDADMAEEMAAFTRAQILMQSGIAMQAQANQLPSLVAQLLR
ncbi:MAG: flagellin [bacterium]|jgi:flagellin|nr:flagellin [bacterium]